MPETTTLPQPCAVCGKAATARVLADPFGKSDLREWRCQDHNPWVPVRTMFEAAVLDRMRAGRIFYIERDGDGFSLCEACDDCFQVRLTRNELRQLGRELMEIADA